MAVKCHVVIDNDVTKGKDLMFVVPPRTGELILMPDVGFATVESVVHFPAAETGEPAPETRIQLNVTQKAGEHADRT